MTGRTVLPGPLRDLLAGYDGMAQTALGQPAATDIDFAALDPLLHHHLEAPGPDAPQTASMARLARHVLSVVAEVVRAPAHGWSGAVHGGLLAATLDLLARVRARHPDLVVYLTQTGHGHVRQAVTTLGLPVQIVRHGTNGAMNLLHLTAALRRNASTTAPALVVASVGTPATEAVDDVIEIRAATATHPEAVHVHADAPLAGWHRGLLDAAAATRAGFDLTDGADSVVLAGQFLGTPRPSAVLLHRTQPTSIGETYSDRLARGVDAAPRRLGTSLGADGAAAAVVQLWHAVNVIGVDGHAARARRARALARYTLRRLQETNWSAWAHPDALTVLLQPPSVRLRQRWSLPVDDGWARIVCMPGRTEAHIDQFLAELARDQPPPQRATVPGPSAGPGRPDAARRAR
ncbi:hypothetical protein ACQP2P_16570 [Dactylosporangium sp. CA-139114]|uniref:hypothetical protein n=1 Tax=Dactylosporangium sp. CA-139114 TaxID=3239931 RepID=UPI003D979054